MNFNRNAWVNSVLFSRNVAGQYVYWKPYLICTKFSWTLTVDRPLFQALYNKRNLQEKCFAINQDGSYNAGQNWLPAIFNIVLGEEGCNDIMLCRGIFFPVLGIKYVTFLEVTSSFDQHCTPRMWLNLDNQYYVDCIPYSHHLFWIDCVLEQGSCSFRWIESWWKDERNPSGQHQEKTNTTSREDSCRFGSSLLWVWGNWCC